MLHKKTQAIYEKPLKENKDFKIQFIECPYQNEDTFGIEAGDDDFKTSTASLQNQNEQLVTSTAASTSCYKWYALTACLIMLSTS